MRELTATAHAKKLVGGCPDNKLHQIYCVCHVLGELYMIEGLLLVQTLTVWGWAPTERHGHIIALDLIIGRARGAGTVDIARSHSIDHAGHRTPQKSRNVLCLPTLQCDKGCHGRGNTAVTQGDKGTGRPCVRALRRLQPPSAFAALNRRSKELPVPPVITWRDAFPFTNVVSQSLAKLVGRALRLLLHEMYTTLASLALPLMIGVRDLVCAVSKVQGLRSSVRPLEADVDDMF